MSRVDNTGSVFLSRLPTPKQRGTVYQEIHAGNDVAIVEGHKHETISAKAILEAQEECQEIEELKKNPQRWNKLKFGSASFGDVTLFCELNSAHPRPYLPQPLRKFVIKQLHNGLERPGRKESVRRVAMYYRSRT